MSNFLRNTITPEILTAYTVARRIYNAPTPSDPAERQSKQAEFYEASEVLRQALGRHRNCVGLFETMNCDEVPVFTIRLGPQYVTDFNWAIKMRRELEQMTRELADG